MKALHGLQSEAFWTKKLSQVILHTQFIEQSKQFPVLLYYWKGKTDLGNRLPWLDEPPHRQFQGLVCKCCSRVSTLRVIYTGGEFWKNVKMNETLSD